MTICIWLFEGLYNYVAHLGSVGKELLRSNDIRLDGGVTLLPADGADLTELF